jgi:hypothetical protein
LTGNLVDKSQLDQPGIRLVKEKGNNAFQKVIVIK